MVITKIIAILALQPPIPFTSISALILPPNANNKDSRSYSADPQEPKARPEPSRVIRTFARNVYVARGDASKIADTDHHRGRDGPLVMTRCVVLRPRDYDGMRDEASARDQEDSSVFRVDWNTSIVQHVGIACGRSQNPTDDEREAMAYSVRSCGSSNGCDGSDYENRYAADMG